MRNSTYSHLFSLQLVVPVLADNHPDDKYLYEVVVETGPMLSHATTSKVNFVLTGDEEETDVRLFNDPDRPFDANFKCGATDAFILSVPR